MSEKAKELAIAMPAASSPALGSIRRIMNRLLRERCGGEAALVERDPARIVLDVESGSGDQGFGIRDGDKGSVRVVGNDDRGLLYGVGKLLRDGRFGESGFEPGPWRGESTPRMPVRGIYFATHFHNFYHEAPVEQVQRYVEDLALWGCNTLGVWFDMHHFQGLDDPAARAMIERLHAILDAARRAGMEPCLLGISNEAYASSPEPLRADWTAGHDGYTRPPAGHYHVEICPSEPCGMVEILARRREMLEAFRDVEVSRFVIWPYDQGGCTCSRCAPWGVNGFLWVAEQLAPLIRDVFPGAEIILSTWCFDKFIAGEWAGLYERFESGAPDWLDGLMADNYPDEIGERLRAHGTPGGLPLVAFPEISMRGMWPWGGYGANPQPQYLETKYHESTSFLCGGFPYSEGIYEDLNKAVMLQMFWDPQRSPAETVAEYAAGMFSEDVRDDVVEIVGLLEKHLGHSRPLRPDEVTDGRVYAFKSPPVEADEYDRCMELAEDVNARLPEPVRKSWRWRVIYLRARLDREILRAEGRITETTEACFKELIDIYQAHKGLSSIRPPDAVSMAT